MALAPYRRAHPPEDLAEEPPPHRVQHPSGLRLYPPDIEAFCKPLRRYQAIPSVGNPPEAPKRLEYEPIPPPSWVFVGLAATLTLTGLGLHFPLAEQFAIYAIMFGCWLTTQSCFVGLLSRRVAAALWCASFPLVFGVLAIGLQVLAPGSRVADMVFAITIVGVAAGLALGIATPLIYGLDNLVNHGKWRM